ncbi:hypothetical protein HMPREF3127_00240 [Sphingobacterium sp. HMSC13C05]|nr:hypothetical protein HMPREF3127_00240 [Sphingobacterium sp. HMSC13C05]
MAYIGEKKTFPVLSVPYIPHLNIAETLWRILKGKWIRLIVYGGTDMLSIVSTGHWLPLEEICSLTTPILPLNFDYLLIIIQE